jgi:hypothetical protein
VCVDKTLHNSGKRQSFIVRVLTGAVATSVVHGHPERDGLRKKPMKTRPNDVSGRTTSFESGIFAELRRQPQKDEEN